MIHDPYLLARLRQRRNRARAEGLGGIVRSVVVPTVGVLLLLPLVEPVFFGFLDLPRSDWPIGARELTLRLSMVVVGWMGVDLYSSLIRGAERDVLATLPVDAGRVARSELVGLLVGRAWWIPAAAVLLSPLARHGAVDLWLRALAVIAGHAILGLSAGANATLAAVAIARDPRAAPFLDAVRGNNPRASAAFLWAPAAVLVAAGGVLWAGSEAVAHRGLLANLGLVLPAALGLLLFLPVPWLARRTWFQASGVVAEIDARHAQISDPTDEARSVYLDWAVRFLPAALRRDALDDLRHGWRTRRTLVTGAWLFGLAAAAGAFTSDGPGRAAMIVVAGALAVGANGVLMVVDEPELLRRLLPRPAGVRALARAAVLGLWTAPVVALGAAASGLHAGAGAAGWVAALGAGGWVVGSALSWALGPLRRQGLGAYGAGAALVTAASLWVVP